MEPVLFATPWSIVPPLIAIILALITKEVYSSLFIGVLSGAILYVARPDFTAIMDHLLGEGIIASLSDSYNVGILVFLVVLGIMVALMNKSGGSKAFGDWAANKVRSRAAAQYSTIGLGLLIFVDDYFNCLTVGSVMKPVTDRFKISRAKLAYLIDSTAAPICIIAPISSWAAAVSGFVEGANGLQVFIQAIPYNFYALLTILMMFAIVALKFDYGPMANYEINAIENGDLFSEDAASAQQTQIQDDSSDKGTISDLVFPVIVLVIFCVFGMVYSGGIFEGKNFVEAFASSDASVGLSMGSIVALVITVIYYCVRRVLSFTDCMAQIPEGFKSMCSPILVLTFAWSLKKMADGLGLAQFVAGLVEQMGSGFLNFVPAVLFVIACGLGIASGTSWGTFGILIPIAMAITESEPGLMIPVISACMAGAVCGDHCSPISDTTIMASAGSACNHITHVRTQFPYAMTVAGVSFITYICAGFMRNPWIPLMIGVALLLTVLFFIRAKIGRRHV